MLLLQFLADDCILMPLLSEYCRSSIFLLLVYTIGKASPGRVFETDVDFGYLSFARRRVKPRMSFDLREKLVSLVFREVASVIDAVLPYAD